MYPYDCSNKISCLVEFVGVEVETCQLVVLCCFIRSFRCVSYAFEAEQVFILGFWIHFVIVAMRLRGVVELQGISIGGNKREIETQTVHLTSW
jgi:hypothetical protein